MSREYGRAKKGPARRAYLAVRRLLQLAVILSGAAARFFCGLALGPRGHAVEESLFVFSPARFGNPLVGKALARQEVVNFAKEAF